MRRVSPTGIITTIAGTEPGSGGDEGPAFDARLGASLAISEGSDGAVLIADRTNQRVRRIARDGTIETIAGTGVCGFSGDGGPAIGT